MASVSYFEPSLKDRILSNFLVVLAILIIIFSGFFILEEFGVILYALIVVLTIGLLILWHSKTRAYKCKSCDAEFEISFWTDLSSISAHYNFRQKMLTCPECKNKDYTSELIKKKLP